MSYTIPYNLYLDVNSPDLEGDIDFVGKEFKFKQKTQFRALRSVLCNLFIAGDRHVMTRRKKESLGNKVENPLEIGYRARNSAVDLLHKAGFVDMDKGDYLEGKETTIVATEMLKAWFKTTKWTKEKITKRVNGYISVRDNRKFNNKAQLLDFRHTKYSRWLEDKLKDYNELLNHQEITIEIDGRRYPYSHFHIIRPFIRHEIKTLESLEDRDFIFGGRMYGPWANASGEERKTILINGEKTIELDRDASHLNAMYQFLTGSPYQGNSDAYHLMINGVEIPRFIVKKYSSLMQGSKSGYRSTSKRVTNSFKEDAEKKNASREDIENYEIFLQWKEKYPPKLIIDEFLQKHETIAKYYRRDKEFGDFISCWESDILLEILIDLTKRGIPALSVYDSVIVPVQNKQYVESIINTMPYQDWKNLIERVT